MNIMKSNPNQNGFSYIETIISMVIVTVGLLGTLSALTWGFVYMQEAEKKTKAKQAANAVIESIFAARDLNASSGVSISGWDAIQIQASGNSGIFVSGWYPVRTDPGADGIYGTTDDSCAVGQSCNSNTELQGYSRKIEITDIVQNNVVRKRRLDVTVQYYMGTIARQEKISTIIADLPFSD